MLRISLTALALPLVLLAACSGGGSPTAPGGGSGGSGGSGGGGNGGGSTKPDPGYFVKVFPPSTAYGVKLVGRLWKQYRLSQPDASSMRVDYVVQRSMAQGKNESITPYVLAVKNGTPISQDTPLRVTTPDEIPQAYFDEGRMAYSRVATGRYFQSYGLQPHGSSVSRYTLSGSELLPRGTAVDRRTHSYSIETVLPFGVVYGEGTLRLRDGSFMAVYVSNERTKVSDTDIDRLILEWVAPSLAKTTRTRTTIQATGFQHGSDMSFLELPDGRVVITRTYRTNRTFRTVGGTAHYYDAEVLCISDAAGGRRLQWRTKLASIHYWDAVTALKLAPDGNIMLAYGGSKLLAEPLATRIVKMSTAGKVLTSNPLQVTDDYVIFDFVPLASGDVLVVGGVRSTLHNYKPSLFFGHVDKNLTVPAPNQN